MHAASTCWKIQSLTDLLCLLTVAKLWLDSRPLGEGFSEWSTALGHLNKRYSSMIWPYSTVLLYLHRLFTFQVYFIYIALHKDILCFLLANLRPTHLSVLASRGGSKRSEVKGYSIQNTHRPDFYMTRVVDSKLTWDGQTDSMKSFWVSKHNKPPFDIVSH